MDIANYPGHGTACGYTAQTWLAAIVNQYLHPGTYFCWFSKTFNAMANGDDSNPMWIYMTLDRAVSQGGMNNAKVKDVKANLLIALDRELRALGRQSDIPGAFAAISGAPLEMFTPQLWRIDVGTIAGRYTSGHQYPDEFSIADLQAHEFAVVIE